MGWLCDVIMGQHCQMGLYNLERIVGPWSGLPNEILKFGSIRFWIEIEFALWWNGISRGYYNLKDTTYWCYIVF